VSRQPGRGGGAAPQATCAHRAAGPGVAFPVPRAIRGTAAQPRPRQARLAVAVVPAGTAGLTGEPLHGTRRQYRPGTAPAGGGSIAGRGGTVHAFYRAVAGGR
jgi:hypothetical protein